MTRYELRALFEKHNDEFLKFERVEPKKSRRADLHGFILLDEIVPNNTDRDILAAAEHDEVYLSIDDDELAAVCYGVQPWFLHQENANIRASSSYISTHQGILRQLKTSYDGVDVRLEQVGDGGTVESHGLTNQQRSIILQMRQEADLIPNNVPADIRDFLSSH